MGGGKYLQFGNGKKIISCVLPDQTQFLLMVIKDSLLFKKNYLSLNKRRGETGSWEPDWFYILLYAQLLAQNLGYGRPAINSIA